MSITYPIYTLTSYIIASALFFVWSLLISDALPLPKFILYAQISTMVEFMLHSYYLMLTSYLVLVVRPVLERNAKIALHYAKAELTPPKPSELGQVASGVNQILTSFRTGRWKQLSVKVSIIKISMTAKSNR